MRDVSKYYESSNGSVCALENINLTASEGDFITIVGSSGCGKTTLLSVIAGLIGYEEGSVLVRGRPVTGPGADRGVVFQRHALYEWLSVQRNVEFGPQLRGVPRRRRSEIAMEYLEMVGLSQFSKRRIWELSGGMQQRVGIARALANDPDILLLDEPFGALDAITRERLQCALLDIWRKTGKTVILITHSVEEALFLGTRVVIMLPDPGRISRELPCAFGRRWDGSNVREIKADPEFVLNGEEILQSIISAADARAGSGGQAE